MRKMGKIVFLSLRDMKQSMLRFLIESKSLSIYEILSPVESPHKSEKVIIWGYHIEHFFVAFLAFVADHITFIFLVVYTYRYHQGSAIRSSIPWRDIIHME
jgi:hypothetical protein